MQKIKGLINLRGGQFVFVFYLSGDLERFLSRERWRLREGETLRSLSRERLRFLSLSLVPEDSVSFLSVESAAIWEHKEHEWWICQDFLFR